MFIAPADSIALFAKAKPEKIAARDLVTGESWNYVEFDDAIGRLASYLLEVGGRPGDRVVVASRNSVRMVMLHLACSRAGLVFAPLNWRLSVAEITVLLELAEPWMLLADPASEALFAGREDVQYLHEFVMTSADSKPLQQTARDMNRPSLLLFTSGTTSKPKGVLLTEKNLVMTGINFGMLTAVGDSSCFLCEAPMFHVIGIVTNIRSVIQQGGTIVVSDGFKPVRTLEWFADPDLGITHYIGVPQMVESFRQQPEFTPTALKSLTALVTGGAPHKRSDILAWLEDGIPVVSGFGMSEAGTIFGMPPDLSVIRKKAGSIGLTVPWLDVQIMDGNGQPCAVNQEGELWIRGENVMPYYYNNPEATSAAITEDGWFRTGDIVRCDEDGFFWAMDRKKDMYISGGENIYPAEIEAVLIEYPDIREVAVFGIPDEKWGEVGCVVAVPVNPDEFDENKMLEFLSTRLARYKIPKKVIVAEQLPRTSTGKLQKAILKSDIASIDQHMTGY
ncbi:AMP-binding protein [Gynuella sunshinyii]|uniref:Acyl-CoA synthetase (AMP-forming)/AMP-acid ligase II n=1 Tax=Gynuella sunshinyii YC6258 TaxID=1445510 RepID=A0A0C5V621_9GAMM|nr:AMP-binding protein [Gynuella sunshinyii]AJQ94905.1 acyl-CoA synthetase (AMP-forming)/AMP-acid ligase II [Gynuella sunshinyii YC6258]